MTLTCATCKSSENIIALCVEEQLQSTSCTFHLQEMVEKVKVGASQDSARSEIANLCSTANELEESVTSLEASSNKAVITGEKTV